MSAYDMEKHWDPSSHTHMDGTDELQHRCTTASSLLQAIVSIRLVLITSLMFLPNSPVYIPKHRP
jgi:hypothetical protein